MKTPTLYTVIISCLLAFIAGALFFAAKRSNHNNEINFTAEAVAQLKAIRKSGAGVRFINCDYRELTNALEQAPVGEVILIRGGGVCVFSNQ